MEVPKFVLATAICAVLPRISGAIGIHGNIEPKLHVYRILPETLDQLNLLKDLQRNQSFYKLDFWQEPESMGDFVDLQVNEYFDGFITNLLNQTKVPYYQSVKDVQKLIDTRLGDSSTTRDTTSFSGTWQRDDPPTSGPHYNFDDYQNYKTIRLYMRDVMDEFPEIARVVKLGETHQGVHIEAMEIGFPKEGEPAKPIMFIDAGIHAREWVAPHVAVYFMHRLTSMYAESETIKILVHQIHWLILPVANPDGYMYSWSSRDPETAMWRKNRAPRECSTPNGYPPFGGFGFHPWQGIENSVQQQCCQGVDLNRNFAFKFGTTEPKDPCDERYAGKSAFSEPETRAMHDWIWPRRDNILGYITMHSYSQAMGYPYGHKKHTYPKDWKELDAIARKAVAALKGPYGTNYKTGSSADIFYTAVGTSFDWAKDVVGIKYTYLLELRPEMSWWTGDEGFFLPKNQLFPAARETWQAVQIVAESLINYSRKLKRLQKRRRVLRDRRSNLFRIF